MRSPSDDFLLYAITLRIVFPKASKTSLSRWPYILDDLFALKTYGETALRALSIRLLAKSIPLSLTSLLLTHLPIASYSRHQYSSKRRTPSAFSKISKGHSTNNKPPHSCVNEGAYRDELFKQE